MVTDSAALPTLKATPADNSAEELTARQVCRFASIALCFYPILLSGQIRSLAEVMPAWWTPAALTVLIAPSAAMFASSWVPETRWLRWSAWAVSISYLVIALSLPLAWNGSPTADEAGAWIAPMAGVASVAAVVAMPMPLSVCFLVGAVTGSRLIGVAVAGRLGAEPIVIEFAWGLLTAAVPFIVVTFALTAGRLVDSTRARTKSRAAETAAEQSRQHERVRLDAITHDGVLSIMFAAARGGPSAELSAQASATLDKLDSLKSEDDIARDLSADEVCRHFESATGDVDAEVSISRPGSAGDMSATYPLEVVRAMMSATSEALHNSARHAGPDATRRAVLTITADALATEVTDDGTGFDQSLVPPSRLGIALSIHGRMMNVPGCSASITSELGAGTWVHLNWQRP